MDNCHARKLDDPLKRQVSMSSAAGTLRTRNFQRLFTISGPTLAKSAATTAVAVTVCETLRCKCPTSIRTAAARARKQHTYNHDAKGPQRVIHKLSAEHSRVAVQGRLVRQ
jgi:hypothetical protein